MALTKTEWNQVEELLKFPHHPVALMCDGFHVILCLERLSAFKNAICVYVNGKMRLSNENFPEETRRFSYPSKRSVHSAKEKAALRKEPKWLRKRLGDRWGNPDATYTVHVPWWGSFKALKGHLLKHNDSIELLKTWRYQDTAEQSEKTS